MTEDKPTSAPYLNAAGYPVPAGTGTFGLSVFLASLGMLFAASMIAYVIIRTTGQNAPPLRTLSVPPILWVSTLFMLASSLTIHRGLSAIRRGDTDRLRACMLVTALLAIAFLAVQAPALYRLFHTHQVSREQNIFLYGLVLMLIGLHAAHVLGGLVPLFRVTRGSMAGRYSQDDHRGVTHCVMYWHFLDAVWVLMFAMFLITG